MSTGGIPLSVIEKWPVRKPTFRAAPHHMANLSACPTCSHASAGLVHFIRRPTLICGQRSGLWMLVAAPGCNHCDHKRPEFNSDDPVALVERWNAYAQKKAALVVQRRGLTGDRAAFFLAALIDPKA